jgi:tetratricopeptide (TPR) repeat protein
MGVMYFSAIRSSHEQRVRGSAFRVQGRQVAVGQTGLLLLILVAFLTAFTGCGSGTTSPGKGPGGPGPRAIPAEILVGTMDTLFKLEEYELGQAEELVMSRLNQWIRDQEVKTPWKREARLDDLPSRLTSIRGVQSLEQDTFVYEHDFAHLREAVWMHRIAERLSDELHPSEKPENGGAKGNETPLQFVSSSDPSELRLAMRLFDWTVRNVQLEAEDWPESTVYKLPRHWHTPYETVLLGRGTASDRAWTFILLARQAGLDVVMLALGEADKPADLRPWIPALVLVRGDEDDKTVELYLFDPALGLPVPGPERRGIATLAQVAADDALLRQLDLDDKRPYPVKAEELKQVTALFEASPGYLSRRMQFLESRLSGKQRLVLTTSPQAFEQKLNGADYVRPSVALWTRPYETLRVRQTDDDNILEAARAELYPLQGLLRPIDSMATDRKTTSRREEVTEWANPQQKGPERSRLRVPLGVGRLMQLAGNYDYETGALRYLQQAIVSEEDLGQFINILAESYRSKFPRSDDPATQQQIRQLVESRVHEFRRADQAAKLWVGQIKAEQGEYATAINYFTSWQNPDWLPSLNYTLARVYEVQGKLDDAIRVYRQDDSPQRRGNLLRARWLEKLKK